MSFKKQMKKHIDQTLDEHVPNPYKKARKFPLWGKIFIPIGSALVTASVVVAIVLSSASINSNNYLVAAPKAKQIQNIDDSVIQRSATKTLEALDKYFEQETTSNYVLSPSSYLLAVSSIAAVSDGFDLSKFGLVDAGEDTKYFLESWNFEDDARNEKIPHYVRFDSGVLHQQVGETYKFDKNKQKEVAPKYIATSKANLNNYLDQATDYFKNKVGLSIPIPDPHLNSDGVITYGAIKMKDYALNGFGITKNNFFVNGEAKEVDTRSFGSIYYPVNMQYYASDKYQAFELGIMYTRLLIILPNEGVSLESISVSEAYSSYMLNKDYHDTMGYVPYFHARTESEDITYALAQHLTGKEKYYSKLLADDVKNDLLLNSVLQTSDFEFNKYGVSGESMTVITFAGAPAPEEHEVIVLNVDRPFYAISLKDNFPIFVNKVVNPLL